MSPSLQLLFYTQISEEMGGIKARNYNHNRGLADSDTYHYQPVILYYNIAFEGWMGPLALYLTVLCYCDWLAG